ncbi:asparaginase [Mesorhizobium sp. J18]|uniref:asparaginase n=1 Tax=Mesorhizobium sp. J18 TaxID=935263 RepID=UPI001199E895|nr:asparaginase [Mesorhizobium sp. J18]TWG93363.1 asparaginase [Mesorhizobium sp. J18]
MANPVLVEVLRGNVVESRHRGAVVVFDADGKAVLEIGDTARPVFPRSAVKAIQALPLIESGGADRFGLTEKELALACASHSGESAHVELARGMLRKAGLDETALECGAHWPSNQQVALALARTGASPASLHNNCSGKHAGFLCTCRHLGIDHRGYVAPGHEMQEMVREAMENVTGAAHAADVCGTDGCSIPTYAVPLASLARGFARMATGSGLGPERAKAARRLLAACMTEPFHVAGTDRFNTQLMEKTASRIFVKTGAEGVYCAAVPELGLGIAIKCDDGAGRASEVMVAAVLSRLLAKDAALSATLDFLSRPMLKNWRGIEVGVLRPAGPLATIAFPAS